MWFDNPESLTLKYQMAADMGLRGVGMWNLDTVTYNSQDPVVRQQTNDMWAAIGNVTGNVTGKVPRVGTVAAVQMLQ